MRQLFACTSLLLATSCFAAEVRVAFSPGDAEALVVSTIGGAKKEVRMAAYSFTSPKVAKALVDAKKRGVDVRAVLDKSQRTERYSGATFLANEGIAVRINSKYAIMHNKFIVVDGVTVETGSFNFTSSAAKRNAENVIVIEDDAKTAGIYTAEWARLWNESEAFVSPQKSVTNPSDSTSKKAP